MATVTENPADVKYKTELVYQASAIEAQISANLEEIGQKIKTKVQHVSQSADKNIQQSEENDEVKTLFNKDEICPDASILYETKNDTMGETFENGNCMANVQMVVENCISEEVQVECESMCVVEDNFLKTEKVGGDVCDKDNYLVSSNDNDSNLQENNDDSAACKTEEENVDFKWEELFTPSQTNFIYPEDEKEIEKLATTLWEMRFWVGLLGRDLHDIITICNFASQWKTLSKESKNYVFQRMSLLYLAVTKGWRYALITSNQHNRNSQKRPAVEIFRGSHRQRKRRRMFFSSITKEIPKQGTEQVISLQQ